jgi:hypothetical protein
MAKLRRRRRQGLGLGLGFCAEESVRVHIGPNYRSLMSAFTLGQIGPRSWMRTDGWMRSCCCCWHLPLAVTGTLNPKP